MIVPPDGLRVRISISDPWDFFTENGPLATGRIVSFRDESADHSPEFRIELDPPLRRKQLLASEVFARLRHRNTTIERFLSGEEVGCNFSNVSEEDWGQVAPEARMGFTAGLRLA
jgi:hypothetical protein